MQRGQGDRWELYANGVLVNTGASVNPNTPDTSFVIGTNGGGGNFFDGKVDDVRIYNRALSATEIKQLYNAGR